MGNLSSNPEVLKFFREDFEEYPPNYGFKAPRKPRVMKITEQEMKALQIPPKKRDYCAHLLKDIYSCKKSNPFSPLKCEHKYHAYSECQMEDYIMGLKEFERSRRLEERQLKKKQIVTGIKNPTRKCRVCFSKENTAIQDISAKPVV